MADHGPHQDELRYVKLADIRVEADHNPRSAPDPERLAELSESVRSRGVLQPLLLRRAADGALALVAGHRRLAAAEAAGLEQVPALIGAGQGAALEDAIVENLEREDLNPVEQATALERALKQGKLSQKALAGRLGKSPGYVRERLRLLRLPAGAQAALGEGELALSSAAVLERIAKVSERWPRPAWRWCAPVTPQPNRSRTAPPGWWG